MRAGRKGVEPRGRGAAGYRRYVISSADEFVRLRDSADPAEYGRAARDEAPLEVWWDVCARFPDYRFWVAQNKTVPLEVLEVLRDDADGLVRWMVCRKRSWVRAHPEDVDPCDQSDWPGVRS